MEEMPFKIMVALLIGAVVLTIGIQAVKTYINIQTRKGFADDVIVIKETMDTLVSMSDKGSFSRVHVVIPKDCKISFSGSKMTVNFFGDTREYNIPGQIVSPREYGPGTYDLVIYYGTPEKQDEYMIAFE